jgi:hypothetical protein
VAAEAQLAPAVGEESDDVADVAVNRCHLRPGDAHFQRAVKREPAARELHVANLIGAAASEPHGRGEVAAFTRGQRPGGRHGWQPVARDLRGEINLVEGGTDLQQLRADIRIGQFQLARPIEQALQILTSWPRSQ